MKQSLRSIRFGWLRTRGVERANEAALIKLLNDEQGITAMEYGLLAAAIAGVLIIVAFFFGNRLGNQINRISVHIN
ncbi:MAG TPA: Flp family type IVb pilin [Polyangia bacterium]|nr:Flp family type IVb pilin [Polyangia bacterium]